MEKESAVSMRNRILHGLAYLVAFMSLGHHIDHAIRATTLVGPSRRKSTPSPTASGSTRSFSWDSTCMGRAG